MKTQRSYFTMKPILLPYVHEYYGVCVFIITEILNETAMTAYELTLE